MNVKTSVLKASFAVLAACALILATLPLAAIAQDVKIISGSPGDTISFTGTGTPDARVRLEVSTAVGVSTYLSGGKYYYKSDTMRGVSIPGGSSMSVMTSPVDTLTVSGSIMGIGKSMDGQVSNHVGTFSMNAPPGTYDIVVSGIANGSPSTVSMTIRASQFQNVGHDGTYTDSVGTSGFPSSVYTVTQDGNVIAMVYLGVQAPATPTPTQVPTPSPIPTNSQGSQGTSSSDINGGYNGTRNASTIMPSPSIEPLSDGTSATQAPTVSPQPGSNSGLGSWTLYILLMIVGSIVGIAAAYLFVLFVVKKH